MLRHRTRRTGQFDYRVTLPQDTDEEHVSAELTDGVLNVKGPQGREGQVPAHRDHRLTIVLGTQRPSPPAVVGSAFATGGRPVGGSRGESSRLPSGDGDAQGESGCRLLGYRWAPRR
ncbi:Hsp20/alpha crystallin family protein [Streptomyces sp. NPDC050743]|uniref:Hsp20/alpha crystallin family protein n=1 Tax=Streptomyces sp. NPDC050743 TaxID=3365634 RepID=UPI00379E005E